MKDKKIAGDEIIVPAEETLDKKEAKAFLEAYKKQNPEKYETKKANGEFDKLLAGK